MSRMVRKQIYIEPRQDEILKRRANELGTTEAELIRQAIDEFAHAQAPLARKLKAWEEAKAVMQERLLMEVPQTGRTWTRDELYEERLERFSR